MVSPSSTGGRVILVDSPGNQSFEDYFSNRPQGRVSNNPLETIKGYKDEYQLIDWMGSSYSGADIKVVVHIYTKAQSDAIDAVRFDSYENDSYIKRLRTEIKDQTAAMDKLFPGTSNYNSVAAAKQKNEDDIAKWKSTEIINDGKWMAQNQPYQTLVLASLQTISVQSHREKYPVRAMGMSYVKGFTRGPRTIGGSMIFTTFSEHALVKLLQTMDNAKYYGESILDTDLSSLIPDQLPPIDCTIVFANEYGSTSRMGIYGLEFVNDGTTFSIEDLLSEGVMNFVARDIDVMTKVGTRRLSQMEKGLMDDRAQEVTGSSLLIAGKDQYEAYLNKVGIQRKYKGR